MALTQIQLMTAYSMVVVLVMALTYVSGDDVILQKRAQRNSLDMDTFIPDGRPWKRPFCNPFSGCGRKRSDKSMPPLLELSSEPAVEELNKQILSQAKLWEAIQEIRAEVERERQLRQNMMIRNMPLPMILSNNRKRQAPQMLDPEAEELYGAL